MQSAKDSFYEALRSRLAVLNPARTIVVRGAVRPAIAVAENELTAEAGVPLDSFLLRWTAVAVDASEPLPLHRMTCVVQYATEGTTELDGMDRGRVLDTMDAELRGMLKPNVVPKQNFAGDAAVTMGTHVFWAEAEFGPAELLAGRLTRQATAVVCALQEGGE